MNYFKMIWIGMLGIFLLTGCSALETIGTIYEPNINKEKVYTVSADKLWSLMASAAKEFQWPIEEISREKGLIKTQIQPLPLAKFNKWTVKNAYSSKPPDCKEGRYHVELLLDESKPEQAAVKVNVVLEGLSCGNLDRIWTSCYSNGDLEKDILNRIEMNLAISKGDSDKSFMKNTSK